MTNKDDKLGQIKQITLDLFGGLGWQVEPEIEITDKIIFVKIEADQPSLLIGKEGETLASLQHILRLMVNRQLDEFVHLVLDISNYKSRQQLILEQVGVEKANFVKKTGKKIVLSPMNSYERRIVHLAIKKIDGISSESINEEGGRRIVIKPVVKD